MAEVYFDSEMDDAARRRSLHNGNFFIFSKTPATEALIALAKGMLEDVFAPHDPRLVHRHMTPEAVAVLLSDVKPNFIHHPECKKIIPEIMKERGADLETLYFDVPRLRSAYPSNFLSPGLAYAFHPHRDTWYSAPMCQVNWWIPAYPIEPDNAIGFYPGYFDQPVKNNSETYNYYEWNGKNRASAQHVKKDMREQPKPQQELYPVTVRYIPPPGGLIAFSGAQLHETVPKPAEFARYSIDFRTVHVDDVRERRGAVNIDSRSTGTTMRDYLRGSDLSHLSEELIAMYDDESARGNEVLYFGDRLTAGDRKPS